MSCPQCAPSQEVCTTVYQQLNPCRCDSPGGIEETGGTYQYTVKGETPVYSVGTVSSGEAGITVVETGYATRVVNWVLPAVPEGVPYTWSEVNTFTQSSVFEQGLETTGGEVTIGGISLTVTPDVTLSGDVHVVGNQVVDGDVTIDTNLNEDANFTVQGDTTLNDVEFFLQTNLEDATMTLVDAAGFVRSTLVIGSCLNPEQQPNVGSEQFTQASASGLNPVGPVDSQPICDPVIINVPASSCMPQITPVCDVRFRIGYKFLSTAGTGGNLVAYMWLGGIGSTLLDFYTQGDGTFNAVAGCIELRAKATLQAGNNSFVVEVQNSDVTETFTPETVTFYLEN